MLKFKSYFSGPSAADLGEEYPTIYYMNKYGILNPATFEALWRRFLDGSIGTNFFPEYSLMKLKQTPSGNYIPWTKITNGFKTSDKTLRIQMVAGFNHRVVVFDDRQFELMSFTNKAFYVTLDPVKTTYGFEILGLVNGKYKWIDFQWITFIESMEGSWDSGPLCGEAFETRYRWQVALLQDEQGILSGTVHFHNCPNGGQAAYHVTGNINDKVRPVQLKGIKVGGAGALYESTPASVVFQIEYGQPPIPNYAP
jgi:hypothetical protein